MIPAGIKCRALLFAARVLTRAAARCFEAATREERFLRAEAEKIAAAGEAQLSEFIPSFARLSHAEGEAVINGEEPPPELRVALNHYYRLRQEAGEAVLRADPAAARRAVRQALRRASGARNKPHLLPAFTRLLPGFPERGPKAVFIAACAGCGCFCGGQEKGKLGAENARITSVGSR